MRSYWQKDPLSLNKRMLLSGLVADAKKKRHIFLAKRKLGKNLLPKMIIVKIKTSNGLSPRKCSLKAKLIVWLRVPSDFHPV